VPNEQSLLGVLIPAAQSQKPFLITDTAAQAVASMLNKWVVASTIQVWHLFLPRASSSFVLSFVMALWFWVDLKWLTIPCSKLLHFVLTLGWWFDVGQRCDYGIGWRLFIWDYTAGWFGRDRHREGRFKAFWGPCSCLGLAMRGHNGVYDVSSALLRLLLSGASKVF
jgi:hypothetical protein